jgi:carbazole 1,9a-dioxygenase terminal dioxygenase component
MIQETVKAALSAELDESRGDVEQAVSRLIRKKPWQPYLDAPLGFRNHWYPALFSHELGEGAVKGEVVLGERIVFKRVDGQVYALEDRCAHRGVRMSVRPECYTKNTLTCWYHGFTYNVTNGRLETIITQPDSPMKVTLQTYPVAERNGLVFVYVGDGTPPPLERDLPPGFLKEGLVTRGIRRTVHCSWRLGAENGFDFTHIYIHRNDALIKARGRLQPFASQFTADGRSTLELIEDEGGPKGLYVHSTNEPPIFEVQIEGQTIRSPRAPLTEEPPAPRIVFTSIWLPGVLQVENFPQPGTIQFEWYVALDDRRHTYWEVLARPVENAEEERRFYEEVDDVWYNLSLTKGFNDSDVFAREQMDLPYGEEDFWYRERLFQPDLYIIQWRMLASRHNRGIQRGRRADP